MSWKNIKDHLGIEHIVCIKEGQIVIGSPYISKIIAITPEGKAEWCGYQPAGTNAKLDRYYSELNADPAKVRKLIAAPDTFSASLPVFTYSGATIIEKKCEAYGWPNCTHDGDLMYKNMFFADKAKAIKAAVDNSKSGIELYGRDVGECRARLANAEGRLRQCETELALLERDYPF